MPREWEEEKKKNQWVAKQLTLNPWNQKKTHTASVYSRREIMHLDI